MILTPEEQREAREEIDYQIETRGYEYVWGRETVVDKTKGLLRDAPGKILGGLQQIGTNPTIIELNNRAKRFHDDIEKREAISGQEQRGNQQQRQKRHFKATPSNTPPVTLFNMDDHL